MWDWVCDESPLASTAPEAGTESTVQSAGSALFAGLDDEYELSDHQRRFLRSCHNSLLYHLSPRDGADTRWSITVLKQSLMEIGDQLTNIKKDPEDVASLPDAVAHLRAQVNSVSPVEGDTTKKDAISILDIMANVLEGTQPSVTE